MGLLDLILLETSTGTGDGGGDGGTGTPDPGDQGTGSPQEGTEGSGSQGDEGMVPRSELGKANREAAKYRTELRQTQERLAELEKSLQTDQERTANDLKAANERLENLQVERLDLLVRINAGQAGITDPRAAADAALLLDWDSIDDPTDENIVKALKQLVKDRPYLRGAAGGASGADGGAGAGGESPEGVDMNSLLRRAAGHTR